MTYYAFFVREWSVMETVYYSVFGLVLALIAWSCCARTISNILHERELNRRMREMTNLEALALSSARGKELPTDYWDVTSAGTFAVRKKKFNEWFRIALARNDVSKIRISQKRRMLQAGRDEN